jgi:ferredoxin
MSGSLEVEVSHTCISSGYCRNALPEVFGAREDRKSFVKTNPVQDSPELRDAFDQCPVEAISAKDAETGEEVFPG